MLFDYLAILFLCSGVCWMAYDIFIRKEDD